jgi:hypothetical protein
MASVLAHAVAEHALVFARRAAFDATANDVVLAGTNATIPTLWVDVARMVVSVLHTEPSHSIDDIDGIALGIFLDTFPERLPFGGARGWPFVGSAHGFLQVLSPSAMA